MSTRTAAAFPVRAAVINTVCPLETIVLALAPAESSASIIATLPLTAASDSGVTP